MNIYQRMGMYFFTVGAILAILAGAFPLSSGMYDLVLIVLIFLGVFSAILNVGEDEEIGFIVAASAFLLAIVSFKFLLGYHPFIQGLASFFEVTTFFIGSMLAVVALRTVFEFGSQPDMDSLEHADAIDDHVDTLMLSEKEKSWNFVVFFAVEHALAVFAAPPVSSDLALVAALLSAAGLLSVSALSFASAAGLAAAFLALGFAPPISVIFR